jgi:hypothetical protein
MRTHKEQAVINSRISATVLAKRYGKKLAPDQVTRMRAGDGGTLAS